MVLQATELGIASCIISRGSETFLSAEGQKLLKKWEIPENYSAVCFVILGYIDGEQPHTKPRKAGRVRIIEQVIIWTLKLVKCRNNWHIHHADKGGGQILICVSGRGWYQEWGKEAQTLHPGDTVNIPAGVKHWHGAAADSWFSHLAVEVPGENCSNEWLEAVDDKMYSKLK